MYVSISGCYKLLWLYNGPIPRLWVASQLRHILPEYRVSIGEIPLADLPRTPADDRETSQVLGEWGGARGGAPGAGAPGPGPLAFAAPVVLRGVFLCRFPVSQIAR